MSPVRKAVLSKSWCMYVLKLFLVTAGNIHSFAIRSKETLRIMYPKYPVLDMIQGFTSVMDHLDQYSFFYFRKEKK